MSRKQKKSAPPPAHWIHSTCLHVVLYSMLLVATPFVMLQNFLQDAIARLSRWSVAAGSVDVPIVPTTAAVLFVVLLIAFRRYITRMRILAGVMAVLMIALAQQITDYYFGHKFYDLQQNWHYIAYAIFAFMLFRDLAPRGHSLARIGLITWIAALLFSTFDETFQLHMSNRVFDIGDIAKDVWGALTGILVLYIGGPQAPDLRADLAQLRHRKIAEYFRRPLSLLVLLFVLSLLLLVFSSLLTEFEYGGIAVLLTLVTFAVFFLLYHFSQFRWGAYGVALLVIAAIVTQAVFYYQHRNDQIVHNRPGLTVYKGFAVPFFDLLIFPDGSFRPVDKKEYFNARDQRFLLRHKPDILLVGTGTEGRGGRGFPKTGVSQFMYNTYTQRGTQVIILRTPDACRLFNRLKREQKNVMFVIHNTG